MYRIQRGRLNVRARLQEAIGESSGDRSLNEPEEQLYRMVLSAARNESSDFRVCAISCL